ncbi:MAG: FecR domain-containing protein [Bacteroidota bacterium]
MPESNLSFESLITSESFQNYCLGVLDEDHAKWDQWKTASPENAQLFKEAKTWIVSLRGMTDTAEIHAEWKRFKQQTEAPHPISPLVTPKRNNRLTLWMSVAASLIFIFASVALWRSLQQPTDLATLQTPYGQVMAYVLPDGSQISLNGNSELRFAETWEGASTREVWLKGEAFFDVAHNEDMPFIVHTEKGDIEVLGTRFNTLQRSEFLRVALLEGSVRLTPQSQPDQSFLMKPGEAFRLSDKGISLIAADLEPIAAWKDHKMIFRGVTIGSIAEKLKWDFNLEIVFKREEILSRKVNAFIQENNPELLLEALAEIYDLNIEKTGEQTYLIK